MTVLAGALSLVLVAVAGVHVLWAIGYWWPIRDERLLVAAAVGTKNATRMPGPIPCALVAVGLIVAAWWPWLPPGGLQRGGLVLLSTVFLIRAILPWRPGWRQLTPQEPFRTLDTYYYGPLCLLIGVGFAVIAIAGG